MLFFNKIKAIPHNAADAEDVLCGVALRNFIEKQYE